MTFLARIRTRLIVASAVFAFSLPALAAEVAVLRNGFSIHHERHEVLGSVTRLYLDGGKSSYVDVPTSDIESFEHDTFAPARAVAQPAAPIPTPPATTDLKQVVTNVSGERHLDPDFVNSVIHAESGFNPHAISPKGAQGLMQLMPQTATNLGVADAFNPQANVEGGTKYLRELLERYHFDLVKTLAAYNAGPQRVDRYGGVPPYFETQAYIARIIREFNKKKLAEQQAAKRQAAAQRAALQHRATPKKDASRPSTIKPTTAAILPAATLSAGHPNTR